MTITPGVCCGPVLAKRSCCLMCSAVGMRKSGEEYLSSVVVVVVVVTPSWVCQAPAGEQVAVAYMQVGGARDKTRKGDR